MKNLIVVKTIFYIIITMVCFEGCEDNRSKQKTNANTGMLEAEVDSLNIPDPIPATSANTKTSEVEIDSLNMPDSIPAIGQDSRLVNKKGEGWIHGTGGSALWSFCGLVFHANDSFTVIIAEGKSVKDWENWVEDPKDVDKWNVYITGTWYTEGDQGIKFFCNRRTITIPYHIDIKDVDGIVLYLDTKGLAEDVWDNDDWYYFGYHYYFKSNIMFGKKTK